MEDLDFKNKVLKQYKANHDCVLSEIDEHIGTEQTRKAKMWVSRRMAIEWTIDDFSEIIHQIILDSFSKET
jgi:hypothetical protein